MQRLYHIWVLFLIGTFATFAQVSQSSSKLTIRGSVKGQENKTPISGVSVSTNSGEYTLTDAFGAFRIEASIGDEIVFESSEFEPVRYVIKSGEDIDVLVQGYSEPLKSRSTSGKVEKKVSLHGAYLDSAQSYKKSDIEKSIDFITKSIGDLGRSGNSEQLAKSYALLGEVYHYHQQFDLAIASFKDALKAHETSRTTILLGEAYLSNREYASAENVLKPLLKIKRMVPFQRVELYQFLGDAYVGLGEVDKGVAFYEEGLKIAKKNQITPKLTDLNSKIADAYVKGNRNIEAEGYYANSLELAKNQAPERSIQEQDKVADFFNAKSRYDEEIQLRKQSLEELLELPPSSHVGNETAQSPDSITSQKINYKIANAYIAKDNYGEAIPFLQKSIVEASEDDDLVVQKDATRKLSEVYKYRGEFDKALETYQDYVAVVDTLYIRKEQEISQAARFNRELASKQSRITGLEQERELSQSKYDLAVTGQELVRESNKRKNWVIYSLILGMALTALAAFFFYHSNKQQKIANNLLALRSLRSQMNPHFIFNALNSVNNYIAKSDERGANRYLSEFSTLMRAVLENSEEDFIPLTRELELLRLYVKLEHSRFPDKFDYHINVDGNIDIESYQIPPMLLQPYIENAIWHGLRYKEEKGFLNVDLEYLDKNAIQITIADNGIGRKKSAALKTQHQKKQKSKGMGNISKRIAILNAIGKTKVDISISDLETNGLGTKVVFTLKKDI